ncbi:MAG: hypothetical protein L0Y58_00175 [Verrucomicrobia subdivision 3 bacterium]|nr:hypothetical protein [Limisphaerales bacterium]
MFGVLVFGVSVTSVAQEQTTAAKIDGVWKWTFTMPDGTKAEPKARLKREGDTLTGASIPRPGMSIPITEAMLDGDKITWTVIRETGGRTVTTRYSGQLDGEVIKGKIESDWAGETRSYDWLAKRAPDTPAGTWKWETAFGAFRSQSTLKLELDGKDKLKGKYKSRNTESDIREGKFKDGEVSFEVVRERDGVEFVSEYRGKLDGDTIHGEMEFDFGGETRTREWIATRADD